MSRQEASAELAAIRKALVTSDWAALEVYGDINGALRRMSVLADAAETRGLKVAITSGRTWRSTRVPEWTPRSSPPHEPCRGPDGAPRGFR